MQDIRISSCHLCRPDKWKKVGESKTGKVYKCDNCGKKTNYILKRKRRKRNAIIQTEVKGS
jgi:uncharacterized Zn finger protein